MNNYDHYNEAELLIATLRENNLTSYGESIQSSIDGGSTGTEIFMAM